MRVIIALKEVYLCIKLACACERVKIAIRKKESVESIIQKYIKFTRIKDKFIDFNVNKLGINKQELQEKIDNSTTADIKQTIQDTPFVKARIQAYESKIERSYDLI